MATSAANPKDHRFLSTHWSVVTSAAGGSRQALEDLCHAYWEPLYCYVRRMGYNSTDAQDLTQGFFARLLERPLIQLAHPLRGRFRTFLLTAFRRFVINEWKRETTVRRGGRHRVLAVDFQSTDARISQEPSHNLTPDMLFERRWAIQVLENALGALDAQQRAAGKAELWERVAPYLTLRDDVPGYRTTAAQCGATPGSLKMAVSRLRKGLAALIRQEIRKTVGRDQDVDDELRNLFAAFRR